MSHYDPERLAEREAMKIALALSEQLPMDENTEEHTGGSVNYYKVKVDNPTTAYITYVAECNDIIESLNMSYAEANVFKAVWRIAASRQGLKKKGNTELYDAEKSVFFAKRILAQMENK